MLLEADKTRADTAAYHASVHDLAIRFVTAIEQRDLVALREIYCAETRVKLNFLPADMGAEESIAILDGLSDRFTAIRYTDIHRYVFEGGFAQHHNFTAVKTADGQPHSLPMCLIALVEDGHIVRIDEYVDTAGRART